MVLLFFIESLIKLISISPLLLKPSYWMFCVFSLSLSLSLSLSSFSLIKFSFSFSFSLILLFLKLFKKLNFCSSTKLLFVIFILFLNLYLLFPNPCPPCNDKELLLLLLS